MLSVCFVTFLLFLINSISIHLNLKQRNINLINNFNLFDIRIFSKKNIIKANGLFLTGLTLQSTRLTSSLLDKTDLNSLLFLISDYSLIILGFLFSILYWKIGPYLNESKSNIFKFAKFSFIYFFLLVTAEYLAYHHLNIQNISTSQYQGLPFCDCLHAPRWMQFSYFAMGPVFFILSTLVVKYKNVLIAGFDRYRPRF